MVFCSATFGAGVVAAQRPITCPKRQLQPERYMPFVLKFTAKILTKIILSDIFEN
jgi:hypothetical protein